MTSPQLPCVLIAQLGFLVPDALQPAQGSELGAQPGGDRRRSAPRSSGLPGSAGRAPPLLAAPSQPWGTCTQAPPPPPASAPGRAGRCHNNWAPAAEAAGEEVTSGGLAVVGTRDPGSVLTGQTAEKELGERGGRGAGRRSERQRAAKSWQRRGAGWGPRGSGARRRGEGPSAASRARRPLRRGCMATGAPGSRDRLVVSGPHGPLTQPRGAPRAALGSRRPCASPSLGSEVGV